ncbi:hypothetical protein Lepto7376_1652 [[Leptolyngbya] sp. PCC 7376]|uniref:hypothetical protein n=1 Tax=[Leptolyngbya] sp. PCC 7376 TaxID=111781 RepID=UPI00029F0795|nr:hypothetical protein [[Leptolyngbya] sp. PCC 7376]AFY37986.1 hypothetical protein Lepto7376_1652 [[Leptolyngbya] sp. PCC 7376]
MAESLQIPIEPFSWSDLNLEQTFRLVDKYIPIQVCLAHSLIPLKFHNHCLTLGIVDPANPNIHQIIKKLSDRKNLKLTAQKLDNKTFQLLLSSYHNYHQINNSEEKSDNNQSAANSNNNFANSVSNNGVSKSAISGESPVASANDPFVVPPLGQGSVSKRLSKEDQPTTIFDEDPAKLHEQMMGNGGDRPTLNNTKKSNEDSLSIPSVHVPSAPVQLREVENDIPQNGLSHAYNRLNITPRYLDKTLDSLVNLPAKQLWQEVLGRILSKGIGRLYFENHADEGRILLSESGVMKEAMYGLPIKTFYGILNEFKRLAHIPPMPVLKAKKAEMEQYYLDERILLRLTIMPGKHGDEGTLQVLRGQALVFHQQKQMDDQGHEALQIAQQLERKLRHIYLRSQINPSPLTALPELLAACDRLKAQLENINRG